MSSLNRPGHDELWQWFGISRASWLTLPRVLMHEMPDEWQECMARLLSEWDETWTELPSKADRLTYSVAARNGQHFAAVPEWMNNYRHPDREWIGTFKIIVTPTPNDGRM